MCVRCHFCPVRAYLRLRDLDVLLNLSGTPQRGFCIQLKKWEEKRREGDLSLLTKKLWISVLRHKTTGIIEVNSAVLFLTGARESQNQNKECRTALNYSKLQPFMFLIHTHVTTTKQTQYIGKTLILTSGWYHCIIMQNEKREKR